MAVERVVRLHLAITALKVVVAVVQEEIATRAEAVGVGALEAVTTVAAAVLHVKEVASTLGRDRPVPAATAVTTTPTPAVETAVMWIGGEKV